MGVRTGDCVDVYRAVYRAVRGAVRSRVVLDKSYRDKAQRISISR